MHIGVMQTLAVFLVLAFAASVCDAQWVQTNGPAFFRVYALAASGTNLYAVAQLGESPNIWGVLRSTNNGENWIAVNNGLPNTPIYSLAVGNQGTVFVGPTAGGGVFASTDSGAHWTAANTGLPYDSISQRHPYIASLLTMDGTLFAAGVGGVYLSINNGASWSTSMNNEESVGSLASNGVDLFAGSNVMGLGGSVFLSTDRGRSWTTVMDSGAVADLAMCGTYLFALHQHGYWGRITYSLHRSSDVGSTWARVNSPIYGGPLEGVGDYLFYGNWGCRGCPEVLVSADYATSWTDVGGGIPLTNNVHCLATDGVYLLAGTYYGVWRRPLSEVITSVEPETRDLPNEFSLEQNYPNPFNPSTTVSYRLPKQSAVTIKVFDVLGREVTTLLDAVEEPGYRSVTFDASKLSSGVYYYRLQAGSYVETKQLVLLK